jgi:hypothetical protein
MHAQEGRKEEKRLNYFSKLCTDTPTDNEAGMSLG